jgi:hypothetical protein
MFALLALAVLVVVVAGYYGYKHWGSGDKPAATPAGFQVSGNAADITGLLALMTAAQKKPAAKQRAHLMKKRAEGFSGDIDGWPGAGVFGNTGDTNPYGNYAEGREMYWPTNAEFAPYFTRS